MNLEKYVTQTSAAAIDTYINIVGVKKFVTEVRKAHKKKLPIKYESLKQSHKLADDLWSSSSDLSEAFELLEAACVFDLVRFIIKKHCEESSNDREKPSQPAGARCQRL